MTPAFMAKTTVMFVDDDPFLLRDLCDFLPKNHFFKTFTNPLEALDAIKLHPKSCVDGQELLLNDFKPDRFEEVISVLVVDHRMKPIDGIEFCQKLGSVPAKRIMLTSHATQDVAIQAFNNKLIDAFLLKTEENVLKQLSSMIQQCTFEFFTEFSVGINGFKSKYNPLLNEDFSAFFLKFYTENNIESHRCFPDFYNVVLKNTHKEIHMTIYDDEHLEDLLASEQAISARVDVINRILNKQAAPCFKSTKIAMLPDGATWEEYMVPLRTVSDRLSVAIG